MPCKDAQHWNRRYQEDSRVNYSHPSSLLMEYSSLLKPNGLALDIAMGTGRNAIFLLEQSMPVIGVDISVVAVKKAKDLSPNIQAVISDLEYFYSHKILLM